MRTNTFTPIGRHSISFAIGTLLVFGSTVGFAQTAAAPDAPAAPVDAVPAATPPTEDPSQPPTAAAPSDATAAEGVSVGAPANSPTPTTSGAKGLEGADA